MSQTFRFMWKYCTPTRDARKQKWTESSWTHHACSSGPALIVGHVSIQTDSWNNQCVVLKVQARSLNLASLGRGASVYSSRRKPARALRVARLAGVAGFHRKSSGERGARAAFRTTMLAALHALWADTELLVSGRRGCLHESCLKPRTSTIIAVSLLQRRFFSLRFIVIGSSVHARCCFVVLREHELFWSALLPFPSSSQPAAAQRSSCSADVQLEARGPEPARVALLFGPCNNS